MRIRGFIGANDSGKTLSAVMIATIYKQKGMSIISNMRDFVLNDSFLNDINDIEFLNGFGYYLILDEAKNTGTDSRRAISIINVKNTHILSQLSKKEISLSYTEQTLRRIDPSLREITHEFIFPTFNKKTLRMHWQLLDVESNSIKNKTFQISTNLFKLYNRWEFIKSVY